MTNTTTGTVRLHRVFRAPPERLFRAFTEPEAFARWLPPHGYTAKVYEQNAVVGGTWRMSFTNFSTGHTHKFGGTYLELEPGKRLRYTSRFDDPNLPGEMTTTIVLTPVSCGTAFQAVQEGIPAVIPEEMCYLGWQESLIHLGRLVEPEIPG